MFVNRNLTEYTYLGVGASLLWLFSQSIEQTRQASNRCTYRVLKRFFMYLGLNKGPADPDQYYSRVSIDRDRSSLHRFLPSTELQEYPNRKVTIETCVAPSLVIHCPTMVSTPAGTNDIRIYLVTRSLISNLLLTFVDSGVKRQQVSAHTHSDSMGE